MMKLRRLIVVMGLMTLILNQGVADARIKKLSESKDLVHKISTHMEMIQEERERYTEPVNKPAFSQSDLSLLAKVSQAESGNQSIEGRVMVVNTVLNRIEDERFPNTVQGVLSQKGQFATWPRAISKAVPTEDDRLAVELATGSMRDTDPLFFEVSRKNSWHSKNLEFLFAIGDHSFYR